MLSRGAAKIASYASGGLLELTPATIWMMPAKEAKPASAMNIS